LDPIPLDCISGLGANERAFEHLSLPGCTLIPLSWLSPEPKETIAHYAERMTAGIHHERPVLMGLSFGGMVAAEMARLVPVRRLWLLSTVTRRSELPGYMRFGKYLPIHKLFLRLNPQRWMGSIENYNLGVEGPEEEAMVAAFRRHVDLVYLRWAIDTIIHWEGETPPPDIYHIHGGKDRIFPIGLVKPDAVVPDGGHFMVHNRAAVVSRLLRKDMEGF
jgi:pimeloyl-ACP methyl ester carboxylesterase